MILIYTHTITPRLSYSMDLVFGNILGCIYQLTNDFDFYNSSSLPKFAYTNINKGFELFIQSDELLFETKIRQEELQTTANYLGFPVFFPTTFHSFLPYDIFATVFYFATRYEEYLPQELDKHQRYQAEKSISFKSSILNKAFLNHLIEDFAKKLKSRFSNLEFKKRQFNFLSTIDIDNAFAFAHKGIKRNLGGCTKDLFSFKFNDVISRIKSNINDKKDPYNTFEVINLLSKETHTILNYFALIGDYSVYDKNPHYTNSGFRSLLKSLSAEYSMGLHPSYESFIKPEKIQIEKQRLEEIIEKKITSVRCHFLRVKFPDTYRHFINAGITDDYTMIYASQSGFRTGLCVPYQWFDIEKNEVTSLTIHPSIAMEGTLRDYNKYTPEEANKVIKQLMQEVNTFGGEFISIFHNDSFTTSQQQWVDVYRKMLATQQLINSQNQQL